MIDFRPYQFPALGIAASAVPVSTWFPGGWESFGIDTYQGVEIDDDNNRANGIYFSHGSFPRWPATFRRRKEDLAQVGALVVDIDFNDWLNLDRRQLEEWSDHDLMDAAHELRKDVEPHLEALHLPPYLTVYSGYGCYFYIALEQGLGRDVGTGLGVMRSNLDAVADALEASCGHAIVNRGTFDPGTRLSRVIGSWNVKNPDKPRLVQVLKQHELPDRLVPMLHTHTKPQYRQSAPGKPLAIDQDRFEEIVGAAKRLWADEAVWHFSCLGVVATMAKMGVSQDMCERVVIRVTADMGDPLVEDRLKTVRSTYARLSSGMPVSGYHILRKQCSQAQIDNLNRVLGRTYRPRFEVAVEWMGPEEQPPPPEGKPKIGLNERVAFEPAPEGYATGWIAEYCSLMSPTTEAPMAFHLGVAATVAGSVIGRSQWVIYGSDRVFPNLYTMLVGVSGKTRKDSAIRRGTSILRHRAFDTERSSGSGVSILTDIGSSEGLLRFLGDNPSTLLHISELSRLMSNTKREVTRTIGPVLMEAWDCPPEMSNQTKHDPIRVSEPMVAALAAVQPDILADQMGDSEIHSGFANRWLYICGNGGDPIPWPVSVSAGQLGLMLTELLEIRDRRTFGGWTLSQDAFAFWHTWYHERFEAAGTPEELAMQQRLPTIAVKLAMIRASVRGGELIDEEDLRTSAELIDWSWGNIRQLIGEWGGTNDHRLVARVEAALTGHGGSLSWAALERLVRSRRWGVREFNNVLKAMDEAGLVEIRADGTVRHAVAG